jgi:hypothetical protein
MYYAPLDTKRLAAQLLGARSNATQLRVEDPVGSRVGV